MSVDSPRSTSPSEDSVEVKLEVPNSLSDGLKKSRTDGSSHELMNSSKTRKPKFWSRKAVVTVGVVGCLLLLLSLGLGLGLGLNRTADKSTWPECVGMEGSSCKSLVLKERPDLRVNVGSANAPYTMDFDTGRVRVFVNEAGFVVTPPVTG
eukprot:CAMPEP_0117675762 /NCGR_PEP_ID=MMETSP0804-20121206/15789_1 /TAXON_ID=1074897 /ORGANISM="Tetraselmis astigmatica, Strain CCMP880" /LENGTH=150 /DNA_ID=CAMNT_0005484809 /DNA_START=214 /DNA_END=666 /DNA_ORIENTATION=+